MPKTNRTDCPDCASPTRRDFLKTSVGAVAAASAASVITVLPRSASAISVAAQPETLVASLYKTLTEEQKKIIAFPFDHPLRHKIDNNWFITKKHMTELLHRE